MQASRRLSIRLGYTAVHSYSHGNISLPLSFLFGIRMCRFFWIIRTLSLVLPPEIETMFDPKITCESYHCSLAGTSGEENLNLYAEHFSLAGRLTLFPNEVGTGRSSGFDSFKPAIVSCSLPIR